MPSAEAMTPTHQRRWSDLDPAEQLQLREAYGHWLDGQPSTCSADLKFDRFRHWLQERGIEFRTEDVTAGKRSR